MNKSREGEQYSHFRLIFNKSVQSKTGKYVINRVKYKQKIADVGPFK